MFRCHVFWPCVFLHCLWNARVSGQDVFIRPGSKDSSLGRHKLKLRQEEFDDIYKEMSELQGGKTVADLLLRGPVFRELGMFFENENNITNAMTQGALSGSSFCAPCLSLAPVVPLMSILLPRQPAERTIELLCRALEPRGSTCTPALKQIALPILQAQRKNEDGVSVEYACWSIGKCTPRFGPKQPELLWNEDLSQYLTASRSRRSVNTVQTGDFKVLHLADIHVDPDYSRRGGGTRKMQICVEQSDSDSTEINMGPFGYWQACGIPEQTFKSAVQHIKNTHTDISYIMETGDNAGSDFWSQTTEGNLAQYKRMKDFLVSELPDVPVYSVVGNHDVLPVNQFPPPSMKRAAESTNKLYAEAANRWINAGWLPEGVRPTIEAAGVYALRLPDHGLRLIMINTLYCYTFNWWSYGHTADPGSQLKWLGRHLQEAEEEGEVVHIIGHVAPATRDCVPTWTHHYIKLVKRYKDIIRAQFYGHDHMDTFNVIHSGNDPNRRDRAESVAFLGPSMHSLIAYNPAYSVYTIDGTTKRVKNIETWYLNLTEATLSNSAEWKKLYDFQSTFDGVPEFPEQWHDFYQVLKNDEEYRQFYHQLSVRFNPRNPYTEEAGEKMLDVMGGYDPHAND